MNLEIIVLLITSLFETYIIATIMNAFFCKNVIRKKMLIAVYVFRYMVTLIVDLNFSYPLINMISCISTLFLITLCYQAVMSKRISVTIIIYMCMLLAEIITLIITGLSGFHLLRKINHYDLVELIMLQIIFGIISLFIKKLKNVKNNMPMSPTFIFLMMIFISTLCLLFLIVFGQQKISSEISIMFFLGVMSAEFLILYLYDLLLGTFEEKLKYDLTKREKIYYQEQSKLLQKNYEQLRQFRHDIKNRMLVIRQLFDNNEIDKVKEYITATTNKLEQMELYSKTGNIIVDSIINYKLSIAKKESVEVDSEIVIPMKLKMEDDDIVIILGNLLDNALDAAKKIKENRHIDFKMIYDKNIMLIEIKNNYNGRISIIDGKIATSKNDRDIHGIGLEDVRLIVEKYHGLMEVNYNHEFFSVNILLYPELFTEQYLNQ